MLRLPVLYKHENLQHISSLHTQNQIRIGTLYDFRKSEHGKGIADALEGTSTVTTHVDQTGMISGRELRGTVPELLGGIYVDDTSTVELNNCQFSSEFTFPDCHILCFSRSNTDAARTSAGREASMMVLDIGFVARQVQKLLSSHYDCSFNVHGGDCHYIPRIQDLHWQRRDYGVSPLFIKGDDARYIDQAEYRLAFVPEDSKLTLKPLITSVPRISEAFSVPNELYRGG